MSSVYKVVIACFLSLVLLASCRSPKQGAVEDSKNEKSQSATVAKTARKKPSDPMSQTKAQIKALGEEVKSIEKELRKAANATTKTDVQMARLIKKKREAQRNKREVINARIKAQSKEGKRLVEREQKLRRDIREFVLRLRDDYSEGRGKLEASLAGARRELKQVLSKKREIEHSLKEDEEVKQIHATTQEVLLDLDRKIEKRLAALDEESANLITKRNTLNKEIEHLRKKLELERRERQRQKGKKKKKSQKEQKESGSK